MTPQFDAMIYAASIWVIPLIIAITFHEAAHGYVVRFFGDNTAWQFGRVTLRAPPQPLRHWRVNAGWAAHTSVAVGTADTRDSERKSHHCQRGSTHTAAAM
jgi:hypothetical protein